MSEIHTRAVNGNGVFHWRFKFNFQYAYLKRKVMIPGDIEDTYLDPIVTLKVNLIPSLLSYIILISEFFLQT